MSDLQKQDFRRMLEDGYEAICRSAPTSRQAYLSDYIFDFTTYDTEMAELFAHTALDVCSAISSRTTRDYITTPERYRWYLVMINMPFFANKIDWGTSVRGAWWEAPPNRLIEFQSCGLWLDGNQLYEPMALTRDQWCGFVAAVLAFGRADPNRHGITDRVSDELLTTPADDQ